MTQRAGMLITIAVSAACGALLGGVPWAWTGPGEARAGVVSQSGTLTVMTSEATNEDLVVVLDGRNEEMFVYRTDHQKGVELFQRIPLARLFVDARARYFGRN